ncbi:MAG: hypothetical protein HYX52_05640 [Chloroflexi bacterium]|nr:hypothetical protein [Chloroflexota bacterium]
MPKTPTVDATRDSAAVKVLEDLSQALEDLNTARLIQREQHATIERLVRESEEYRAALADAAEYAAQARAALGSAHGLLLDLAPFEHLNLKERIQSLLTASLSGEQTDAA